MRASLKPIYDKERDIEILEKQITYQDRLISELAKEVQKQKNIIKELSIVLTIGLHPKNGVYSFGRLYQKI